MHTLADALVTGLRHGTIAIAWLIGVAIALAPAAALTTIALYLHTRHRNQATLDQAWHRHRAWHRS